jgi:hypothetical protein
MLKLMILHEILKDSENTTTDPSPVSEIDWTSTPVLMILGFSAIVITAIIVALVISNLRED